MLGKKLTQVTCSTDQMDKATDTNTKLESKKSMELAELYIADSRPQSGMNFLEKFDDASEYTAVGGKVPSIAPWSAKNKTRNILRGGAH